MRLVTPTDFDILEALDDGYRNNAVNLAEMLGRDRQYINTRLPALLDYGLVERIGPADNSGLYAITPRGQAVVEHRDAYGEPDVDFDELVSESVENA